MNDCLFCKIIKGEIPSYKVYEDHKVYPRKEGKRKREVHT